MQSVAEKLDQETIQTLQATVEFLAEHGVEITSRFYQRMLSRHPELKNIFNLAHQHKGEQQQALANAVYGFAKHLENLPALEAEISRIAHKHVSLNIQAEQYAIVGENLLAAIHAVVTEKLDSATADAVTPAWGKAYWVLADILIATEEGLYQQTEQQQGGWRGLREFTITRTVTESQNVTSFYLSPVDNQPITRYQAGQYISVYVTLADGTQQIRQYSLSDSYQADYYRISVKRDGLVSSHIHDTWQVGTKVKLSPPAGDFTLQENTNKSAVFLSAGVGITPMVSMVNQLLSHAPNHKAITFVHGNKSAAEHSFQHYLQQTAAQQNDFKNITFYEDSANSNATYNGIVDLEKIKTQLPQDNADFYLCGPKPFMAAMYTTLTQWGIAPDHIHYEVFGSNKSLT